MAEVIWTIPALGNLEEIAEIIALDKPDAAKNFVQKVFARVEKLADFPLTGNVPRELKRTPYRRVVVAPTNIYYRIENENVLIVYVARGEKKFTLKYIKENEK